MKATFEFLKLKGKHSYAKISYGGSAMIIANIHSQKSVQKILDGKEKIAKISSTWFCNQTIYLTDEYLTIRDRSTDSNPINAFEMNIPNNIENKVVIRQILELFATKN